MEPAKPRRAPAEPWKTPAEASERLVVLETLSEGRALGWLN